MLIMLKIHFSSGIAARSCLSVKNDEKIIVNKRMIWPIITPQILSYTVKKYPEGFSFERLY
ncbi:MAG: hypothetical protein BHW40_08200 [Firmicutes bacterium CAG:65_45_313]|nr:MAG: hypothetical protein BHW40_08200 [Firmicutes bacterium CAG:65_45_313]